MCSDGVLPWSGDEYMKPALPDDALLQIGTEHYVLVQELYYDRNDWYRNYIMTKIISFFGHSVFPVTGFET